jgi:hypothetical protein
MQGNRFGAGDLLKQFEVGGGVPAGGGLTVMIAVVLRLGIALRHYNYLAYPFNRSSVM